MSPEIAALRAAEYPWMGTDGIVYLDHASTGALPASAVAAMQEYLALRHQPQLLRAAHFFPTLQRSRALAAELLGATPEEIALTTNTSHGLNLAAFALPIEAGDEILTVDREFPSNMFPWLAVARRRGASVVRVPGQGEVPDEAALLEAIATRPRVKVVTVSWVSFCSGARLDLEAIGAACASRGIFFVVDAIQGVGAMPIDVRRARIDVLACGAQKWLQSPWGTGFTYVRRELIASLEPPTVGWMATRGSEDFSAMLTYDETWFDDARKFELITLPMQDFAGMNASLSLLLQVGAARIGVHLAELGDAVVAWADATPGVRLVTPRARAARAGVFALVMPDVDAASARLRAAGVVHSVREGAVRLSPHWYTTLPELQQALHVLAS